MFRIFGSILSRLLWKTISNIGKRYEKQNGIIRWCDHTLEQLKYTTNVFKIHTWCFIFWCTCLHVYIEQNMNENEMHSTSNSISEGLYMVMYLIFQWCNLKEIYPKHNLTNLCIFKYDIFFRKFVHLIVALLVMAL